MTIKPYNKQTNAGGPIGWGGFLYGDLTRISPSINTEKNLEFPTRPKNFTPLARYCLTSQGLFF